MRYLVFLFAPVITFAASINPNLPGKYKVSDSGPAAIVANFYEFALMFGGLLAFAMILYGGIRYTLSRGNPSQQSDAKDAITQALVGLLLLLGAYIILNTINPNLVKLTLPVLEKLKESSAPGATCGPDYGYCAVGTCVSDTANPGKYKCSSAPNGGASFGCFKTGTADTLLCASAAACQDLITNGTCRAGTCATYPQACSN